MSKSEYQYKVISKIDNENISKKLRPILLELNVGELISTKSFFDKHKDMLCFKNDESAKNCISNALKIAYESNRIERTNDKAVPKWFKKLDSVSFWISQLRGSKFKNPSRVNINTTQTQYLHQLWQFNKWISEKTFRINTLQASNENSFVQKTEKKTFSNVEFLLRVLEQPFADQKNITRIIKQYLLDEIHAHKKASYMLIIKSAIVSYFEKNEYSLQINYNPKTSHDTEIEEQDMSISDLMDFLTTGKPSITEKATFLCKFHRGLDVSTLVDRFNYEALDQIAKWFGSENHNSWDLDKCPVPISLTRIKTDYKHIGFLDRDAIDVLQKYLDYRKTKTKTNIQKGEPLFLNKFNKPISTAWMFASFSRIAKRSGIQKFTRNEYGKKFFKVDSHELRDLLKSTLIDSGCRIDIADHVIGHKPRDSYEKQAKLYPETLRKEYSKASKRLNIFTKFSSVVNGTDDSDELRISLKDKLDELEKIKQRSLDDEAEKIRNDKMAEQNVRQMSQMMDMINELKTQKNSTKNNKSDELEFCCIKCSTIHKNQKCPVCDSKLKRIYE